MKSQIDVYRFWFGILITLTLLEVGVASMSAMSIAPMSWTTGRSDWINVKTDSAMTVHAAGDGTTDDTAALQQAMNLASASHSLRRTVYLPAGTYKVTSTLYWSTNFSAIQAWPGSYGLWLVGCGSNTTIQWAGTAGQPMLLDQGSSRSHYEGIVWNAGPSGSAAGYAIVHDSAALYQTRMRHENEAFIGFTGVSGQGTITVPYVYTWTSGVSSASLSVGATSIPLTSIPTGLIVGAGITGTGIPTGPSPNFATTTTVTAINTSTKTITISAALNHASTTGTPFAFISSVVPATETTPAAGIICGVKNGSSPIAETMLWNCLFQNDTNGVIVGYEFYNDYMWIFKSCEFENCGTGVGNSAGKIVVEDTHFSGSTTVDVSSGLTARLRRCTSAGSKEFYHGPPSGTATATVLEDCWVDGWTDPNGAVVFPDRDDMAFDCVFTHPPSGAHGAISEFSAVPLEAIYSNNYCSIPSVPVYYVEGGGQIHSVVNIPSGSLTSTLTSPNQTFLKSTWPADGGTILDITQAPYNAVNGTDCTAAIQAAITQAKTNNNGTIVYIPCCNNGYSISSTLNVSGGNYTIEGSGYGSSLAWLGSVTATTPIFTVTSPQNIEIEQLLVNIAQSAGISSQPCISETSTGASSAVYDEVSSGGYTSSPGIVLTSLPGTSVVHMPLCDSALTVKNCGAATILSDYLCFSGLNVTGSVYPPSGFLGALVLEGGQMTVPTGWDMTIDDNQNFAGVDYYNESTYNHLLAKNTDNMSWAGKISMQGFKEESVTPSTTISIQNYKGRIFYGPQGFLNNGTGSNPTFTQTGTALVDLILMGEPYYASPNFTLTSACNLIAAANFYTYPTVTYLPDTLPTGWGPSAAAGLDFLRVAGNYDLNLNYGLFQGVTNTSFEADAVNPDPTGTIGYTPAGWTISNALETADGTRNLTVVSTPSPFGPGAQGLLWTDTTDSTSGYTIAANQYTAPLPASQPGIWSFDFRLNSDAADNDIWIRAYAGSTGAGGLHIISNGTTTYLGAGIGGHDSYVMTPAMDTWYRARIVVGPANAGPSNATLYLTPWTSTGPGMTTSYTIDGIVATSTTGIGRIYFTSGTGPGADQDANFDNVQATNNPVFALP